MQNQNHQHPMQNMSLHNLPPQPLGPQLHVPTSISPAAAAQFSEVSTAQDLVVILSQKHIKFNNLNFKGYL